MSTKFQRAPAKRVFIEDLTEGQWNEGERLLATRYGNLKKVRVCATVITKKESESQGGEDMFKAENQQRNARVTFQLDDGTGRIWSTRWAEDVEDYEHITPGVAVEVVGSLRSYRNNPQLTLDFIRPITDPNYEQYHILGVLKTRKTEPHHEIEALTPQPMDDFNFDDTFGGDYELKGNPADIPTETDVSTSATLDSGTSGSGANYELADRIVTYIQEKDDGDGVFIGDMEKEFSVAKPELKQILDRLSQDVKIYKTAPNHYSSY